MYSERGLPVLRQVGELGQARAVVAPARHVPVAALTGIEIAADDLVVILDTGIAVQAGVNPGQVIGIVVVLDDQLPVALKRQLPFGIGTGGIDLLMGKVLPAVAQGTDMVGEVRRLARQVHENQVEPDRRAHRLERELVAVERRATVGIGFVDQRRGTELAGQVVSPGVVGTAHHLADIAGLGHQLQPAMAADVVKDLDAAFLVAQQQQRNTQQAVGPRVAGLRDVLAGADAGPGLGQAGDRARSAGSPPM